MKIFISYAREDIKIAKKLYYDLKEEGLKPFLDVIDMLPGEKWELAIQKAIKSSKYVIILISPNSVIKKGFIQKEISYSIDLLEQFPDSEIFIIPVRLDDCEPTRQELQELHWADLFPSYDEGLRKILCAIKDRKSENSNVKVNTTNIRLLQNDIIGLKSSSNKKTKTKYIYFLSLIFFLSITTYTIFLHYSPKKDLTVMSNKQPQISSLINEEEINSNNTSLKQFLDQLEKGDRAVVIGSFDEKQNAIQKKEYVDKEYPGIFFSNSVNPLHQKLLNKYGVGVYPFKNHWRLYLGELYSYDSATLLKEKVRELGIARDTFVSDSILEND